MLLTNCAVCESKRSRFIKEQEANGLLSSLGIKRDVSFWQKWIYSLCM